MNRLRTGGDSCEILHCTGELFINQKGSRYMSKKITWLLLSFVLVAALVLASCQPAAVEEEKETETITGKVVEKEGPAVEEEEEEAAPAVKGPEMITNAAGKLVEKPQYGGICTFYMGASTLENIDPVRSALSGWMCAPTYETPVIVDWSMGPQGTGENAFLGHYMDDVFLTGCLAESWEIVDLSTIILQIRQGVHWHDKPPVNGREMTVDDILATFYRYQENPLNTFYRPRDVPVEEWTTMEETGPWEITFKYYEPSTGMLGGLYWLPITPKEAIETWDHLREVERVIGTGPFVMTDIVTASSVTWHRHPNYWMEDPLIPGNQLPYIETLRGIAIPDYSTQLAALRTHKLDIMGVGWEEALTMMETNPELKYRLNSPSGAQVFFMRTDLEGTPWANVKVRQALNMAVDQPAIAEDFYGGMAFVNTWPIQPMHSSVYTPVEELPDNLRWLYEYQPEKAKELLAEAGYPNGFKCKVNIYADAADITSIVKEYFMAVGVDMEIVVHEGGAFGAVIYGRQYEDLIYSYWGNADPSSALTHAHGGVPSSIYAFSNVVDPLAEEYTDAVKVIVDPEERNALTRAENLRQMELCWEVMLPAASGYAFWGPWLKGFMGEVGVGPTAEMGTLGIYRYMWMDLDLKYEITGQR